MEKKPHKGVIRKVTFKNPSPQERALYYEVGKKFAADVCSSWYISAIKKQTEKDADKIITFYRVFIIKDFDDGTKEESVWKDVELQNPIIEYDIS